jgi:hypothetical protein
MKKIFTFVVLAILFHPVLADFPMNNVDVTITQLEVWPSNSGASRYNVLVSEPIENTGCANLNGFSIEEGPGANAAYSTLLAAVMAGKKVQLYLTRCEYFVVADRIRVIP